MLLASIGGLKPKGDSGPIIKAPKSRDLLQAQGLGYDAQEALSKSDKIKRKQCHRTYINPE